MEQVIVNLAVNARDAMPKGGRLLITTGSVVVTEEMAKQNTETSPGEFACMIFSDTGCGIPPENIPHLFEPFFTTKEIGKGTGLGLATTYGIVKQHRGWIKVESKVGEGTTFYIFLPRSREEGAQTAEPTDAPMKVRGGAETILVVEDEPFLRKVVRGILEHYGYRVLEASNGTEALNIWGKNRDKIDLLLTDIVMPEGMSGRDVAEKILTEQPNLQVIYMSGYNLEIVGANFALQEGINFLQKPFHPQKLAQTIRDCLDKKCQS
jgi:CheY-like chemotaxis protein